MTKLRAAGRLVVLLAEDGGRAHQWLARQWWIWAVLFVAMIVEGVVLLAGGQ